MNQGCILTTDLGLSSLLLEGFFYDVLHAESAMPLLQFNITTNAKGFQSIGTYPRALVLDWDNDVLPEEVAVVRDELDVIVYAYFIYEA